MNALLWLVCVLWYGEHAPATDYVTSDGYQWHCARCGKGFTYRKRG